MATTSTTLIDVVDEAGRPVGVSPRDDALRAGLPVRTVHVFLLDRAGRLLLQELGRERDRHPLQWGSSVAGFPRPGEPDDDAAARRAAEELGVRAPLRRVGQIRTVDGASPKFVTLYEARETSPRILEPGHVERIEYRSVDELDTEIIEAPSRFTDTFRQVYGWWREQRR